MRDPDIIIDPVLVVRLGQEIPVSPFKEPSLIEMFKESENTYHCNECGHDFTPIREDDGERYLPTRCPRPECDSRDVEKFNS